jgi:hypothetical protein
MVAWIVISQVDRLLGLAMLEVGEKTEFLDRRQGPRVEMKPKG